MSCFLLCAQNELKQHTDAVQNKATEQYKQEFEAFQSGKYKESAQNWLHSSWQGDALQVQKACSIFVMYHSLVCHRAVPFSKVCRGHREGECKCADTI